MPRATRLLCGKIHKNRWQKTLHGEIKSEDGLLETPQVGYIGLVCKAKRHISPLNSVFCMLDPKSSVPQVRMYNALIWHKAGREVVGLK